ncbi:vitamin K epoxide reductase family protein [Wenzhouxiangella sp. XN79A]|uniref:vitamin K epoxide reductase family protein n=1 Tax=Wenzhouxiangella sp. XN79A TaxID=2724193 RepID=UPI00144AA981|nr:vitamin K epoxide reductase family protein [Wenzhouxiangella sp. XN79A]NKI34971.1 vitamin K epoxide reductase family protein [Wenzhouxiangella sp. XN79A]
MSRKRKTAASARSSRPASKPASSPSPKLQPDRVVAVLAGLGVLITAFLTFTGLTAQAPLFCGPDSGCDLVQNSRYATLLGLPVALWGLLMYLAILWSAVLLPPRLKRWRRLAWLTTIGLAISVYFTLTGWLALDAWCGWCLASQVVMLALLIVVFARRPESAPGEPWPRFAGALVLVAVFAAGGLHAWQNGWLLPPEDPQLRGLAEHLEARGAKYYGAFWCPNCQDQRQMFGRSADRLPYVECSPNGRRGSVAVECVINDIDSYPTWVIDGRQHQRVLSLDELARLSGYREWNREP